MGCQQSQKAVWILETSGISEEERGPVWTSGTQARPPVATPSGTGLRRKGSICPFRTCLDYTSSAFSVCTPGGEGPAGPVSASSLAGPWWQELLPLSGLQARSLLALLLGSEKPSSRETAKPHFPGL